MLASVRHVADPQRRRARRLRRSGLARLEAGRGPAAAADRRRDRVRGGAGAAAALAPRSASPARRRTSIATPIILNSFTKSYIIDRAVRAALADRIGARDRRQHRRRPRDARRLDRNRRRHRSARQRRQRRAADPARACAIAPSRRAAATAAASTSAAATTRTSSIRGPDVRPSQVVSATVVADRAADAGALATAFCVLTPEDSERLARRACRAPSS